MNFINTGQSRHVELIKDWLGSKPGFKTYLPVDKAEDLVYRKVAKYVEEKNDIKLEGKAEDVKTEVKVEETKVKDKKKSSPKKVKKTTKVKAGKKK